MRQEDVKLNIFALPSQTIILVSVIIGVILGAILIGSIGPSPIPMWPLALGLFLLPLRSFLAWPKRECKSKRLSPAGEDFKMLQNTIASLSRELDLPRTPCLLIGENSLPLHTFGSFRRWFLAVGHSSACEMQDALDHPKEAESVQAGLLHELGHFKHGDYWQVGYTRELLRLTPTFMLWAFVFFLGYGFFLIMAKPWILDFSPVAFFQKFNGLNSFTKNFLIDIFPTEMLLAVQNKAEGINLNLVLSFIASATLPFVLIVGVLWLFYWRKFLRMREFYADAIVAHTQKSGIPVTIRVANPTGTLDIDNVWGEFLNRLKKQIHENKTSTKTFRGIYNSLWETHPQTLTRIAALMNPSLVFDNWIITALLIGALVLLLDILILSPLTLLFFGELPMHFVTTSVFLLVTLNLIPSISQGRSVRGDIFKIVTLVCALRFLWLALTIGLMIVLLLLGQLNDFLVIAVASVAHFAGYSDDLGFADPSAFLQKAAVLNLAQVFIVYILLIVSLLGIVFLLHRVFTWYSFPDGKKQILRLIYGVVAISIIFINLGVLLPVTKILLEPTELFAPLNVSLMAFGLSITIVMGIWFKKLDHKYANRCPSCDQAISSDYYLGKTCECGEVLNPWLLAEYKI
jgi:hypothetical protein